MIFAVTGKNSLCHESKMRIGQRPANANVLSPDLSALIAVSETAMKKQRWRGGEFSRLAGYFGSRVEGSRSAPRIARFHERQSFLSGFGRLVAVKCKARRSTSVQRSSPVSSLFVYF